MTYDKLIKFMSVRCIFSQTVGFEHFVKLGCPFKYWIEIN